MRLTLVSYVDLRLWQDAFVEIFELGTDGSGEAGVIGRTPLGRGGNPFPMGAFLRYHVGVWCLRNGKLT